MLRINTRKRNFGRKNRKLSARGRVAYRRSPSAKKKDRMGFLLRRIMSLARLLREFKSLSGEFSLYKNRIRDCEYEIYKFRKVLYKKGIIDKKFLMDFMR